MGEIRKINRETGEDMGVVGNIEANEIAGRPFICVYGVSRPRVAGEKKIVEKELFGGLKAYVRFETSDKLTATVGATGSFVASADALEPLGFASEDELWAKAIEATIAEELSVMSMLHFMGERMGIPEDMLRMGAEHSPMDDCYIVTLNGRGGVYGAGAMAVPCLMEQVREKIGNFYILPSSVQPEHAKAQKLYESYISKCDARRKQLEDKAERDENAARELERLKLKYSHETELAELETRKVTAKYTCDEAARKAEADARVAIAQAKADAKVQGKRNSFFGSIGYAISGTADRVFKAIDKNM